MGAIIITSKSWVWKQKPRRAPGTAAWKTKVYFLWLIIERQLGCSFRLQWKTAIGTNSQAPFSALLTSVMVWEEQREHWVALGSASHGKCRRIWTWHNIVNAGNALATEFSHLVNMVAHSFYMSPSWSQNTPTYLDPNAIKWPNWSLVDHQASRIRCIKLYLVAFSKPQANPELIKKILSLKIHHRLPICYLLIKPQNSNYRASR